MTPGALVRYTRRFLRSVGWYVGVPLDGLVVATPEGGLPAPRYVYVVWCDDPTETPQPVNTANLEPIRRAP